MDYRAKIDHAIRLLRAIPQDGPVGLSYSGGKDSDVILELARMSGIKFDAIYKNTTIDPPGTIAHCKANGVRIINPEKTMLQIIRESGWPSRRYRFCCDRLKKYKTHDCIILGIRREESEKRKKLYKEPEQCRVYKGGAKVRQYYPILYWTREDELRFIEERGVKCHPLYYDADGSFRPERRLGCIGCPLAADGGRSGFVRYPKMLTAWVKAYCDWWESHPGRNTQKIFCTPYDTVYWKLFCKSEKQSKSFLTLLRDAHLPGFEAVDTRTFLSEYFKVEL